MVLRLSSLVFALLVAVAACSLPSAAQAAGRDYATEAKAASASALSMLGMGGGGGADPGLLELCPCSKEGACRCDSQAYDCGCVSKTTYPWGKYRWVETSNPNQMALYWMREQRGNWWLREGEYKRLEGEIFTPDVCPVPGPRRAAPTQPQTRTLPISVGVPLPRQQSFYLPNTQPVQLRGYRTDRGPSFSPGNFRGGFSSGGSCGPSG
jgi:hypothetical protein